jgi:hypothetical protein
VARLVFDGSAKSGDKKTKWNKPRPAPAVTLSSAKLSLRRPCQNRLSWTLEGRDKAQGFER